MRTLRYAFVATLLSLSASPDYNVMEQLGFPKRVSSSTGCRRREIARSKKRNNSSRTLWKDFIAVTGLEGGALQEKYDHLQSEYERSS